MMNDRQMLYACLNAMQESIRNGGGTDWRAFAGELEVHLGEPGHVFGQDRRYIWRQACPCRRCSSETQRMIAAQRTAHQE
jgi:hypothetical protein